MKEMYLAAALILSFIQLGFGADSYIARVVSVSDGDTIKIQIDKLKCPLHEDGIFAVRLLGVDTPESSRNEKAQKDALRLGISIDKIVEQGKLAKQYTASALTVGAKVIIEFDVERNDKYGRLLAYVYVYVSARKTVWFNEKLIKDGYAYPFYVDKLTRIVKGGDLTVKAYFEKLYWEAVAAKKGLWK